MKITQNLLFQKRVNKKQKPVIAMRKPDSPSTTG